MRPSENADNLRRNNRKKGRPCALSSDKYSFESSRRKWSDPFYDSLKPAPIARSRFCCLHDYSAAGAPTGQTSAQLPHSMQVSGLISYLPSPSKIASTGHSAAHAPQEIHSLLILYAIVPTSFSEYNHIITCAPDFATVFFCRNSFPFPAKHGSFFVIIFRRLSAPFLSTRAAA